MGFIPDAFNAKDAREAIGLIGLGFVARETYRLRRGARTEDAFAKAAWALLYSAAIYGVVQLLSVPVAKWVPSRATALLVFLSWFSVAVGLGYAVAWLASRLETVKAWWVRCWLAPVPGQTLLRTLVETPTDTYLQIELIDGRRYQGTLRGHDFDPERFKDMHIVLDNVAVDTNGAWTELASEVMIVSADQIRLIHRLPDVDRPEPIKFKRHRFRIRCLKVTLIRKARKKPSPGRSRR